MNNNLTTAPEAAIKTSQNQIAGTYNKYHDLLAGSEVLDFGAGRYHEKLKEYANNNSIMLSLYDPYNPAIAEKPTGRFDIVINNNVLNVIESPTAYEQVVNEVLAASSDKVIFKVYTGNRSGVGAATKIGTYQRNQTAKQHLQYMKSFLPEIIARDLKVTGDYITLNV